MAMCFTSAGLPEPCGGFTVYDSYATDPRYQKYFTIGWTCTIALAFLFTVPSIIRYATSPRFLSAGLWSHLGLIEDLTPGGYLKLSSDFSSSVPAPKRPRHILPRSLRALSAAFTSLSLATLPLPSFLDYTRIPFIQRRRAPSCHPTKTYAPFSLGTLLLALLVPLLVLSTLLPESQLRANPNRFGFLALASIPPLFVLSSKNGAISILLGKGWTGANFLHRWLGRIVVLLVLLHFYFWTIQWVASNRVEEFLSQSKERRGIGALVFLLVIAVSSAGPLRRVSYPIFFVLHYVGIIGFLVFVNRHTVYAKGWATWSVVGIYAFDIVGRLLSMRVRYVEVEALDSGMVRIGLTGVHSGWRAGQHLSIRLFFAPPSPSVFSAFRMFEAHPFSISNAPPSVGVLNSGDSASRGIDLFARSCGKGSWTGDLYATAELGARVAEAKANDGNKRVLHMLALVEGPYGGIGPYREVDEENVLLVAGGSGMGFTLGILDELVGRRVNSRTGGKIEVVWAVRERSHITWFASRLRTLINAASSIPGLSMTLRVYVTCDTSLSSAEDSSPSSSAAPSSTPFDLPHTQLLYQRPQLFSIIQDTIGAALAPCGSCYPVCHCGEDNSDGMCANVEEECCGNGPANGRELLSEKSKDTNDDDDEQGDLPKLEKKSCCKPSPPDSDEEDEITVLPPSPLAPTGGASCCKPKAGAGSEVERKPQCGGGCCAGTGAGCCSGGVEGVGEKRETGPLKIRTDGLAVTVCGPGGMIAEMRNAVARVPMAKQARIGGITLHAEHFSV